MAIIQRFFPTTSGSFAGNGSGLTNVTATTALTATSASYALTASYAMNGGGGGGSINTGSFATTGSNTFVGTQTVTGSIIATGEVIGSSFQGTASQAISASYASTASFLLGSVESASYASTASYANQAISSSYASSSEDNLFTIHTNFANINPADATTYYFGAQYTVAPGTGATARILYIPYDCILIAYTIGINYNVGSSETSELYCRINNTTDVQLGGNFSGAATIFTQGTTAATNLSAGDYLNIKWVCPTWATNPTAATGTVILYLKRR
jgi:hypothetical protein